MSCVQVLIASLSLLVTIVAASPTTSPPTGTDEVDFQTASRLLVKDIRDLASRAKSGMAVQAIAKEAFDLQNDAAGLITQLSDEVPQCETDLVIKTAAAGVGSHEVLTLMLADDELEVLNGRMSLSLVFLERVAQQLEDQLALSDDLGPQLAAVVFGTNATVIIAGSADATAQTIAALKNSDTNAARRDIADLPLGSAWSLAQDTGLRWRSSLGRATVLLPTLGKGGATLKRGSGTSLSLGGTYDKGQGLGLQGSLKHEWGNGRGSWHISPSWSQRGGFGIGAGLSFSF